MFLLACCRKSSRVKSCWRRIRETLKNEKRNGVQQREPGKCAFYGSNLGCFYLNCADIVSDVSSPADSGTSTAASSPRQTISTDDVGKSCT